MSSTQVYKATEGHVKIIGRTYYTNDVLWLALSGAAWNSHSVVKKINAQYLCDD
ncbi:hypothetical protein [Paenibacillus riograndensis]|uniref:Uncharacterized protein n=1 Tax=Paenibacillus riograndensis SBR5 TaxID=1073571 RepID=A0A0E3WHC4_9BACL|nr:hypothetical protein [Paenibacillus riograndensis]CQR55043.1 hypothetical protein PRIO_2639 [Paenibacillus riograndensis SBR5]